MTQPQNRFERLEYKYWVSDRVTNEVMRYVAPYLHRDDQVAGDLRITTLCLDSSDRGLTHSHMESDPARCQLRVRAYGEPPADPTFLEIKREIGMVTFKQRARVPRALLARLLRCEPVPELQIRTSTEEMTLAHFLYLMITNRAQPTMLVTCRRQAYKSVDADEGARLTVDREIRCQPARDCTLEEDPSAWAPLCGIGSSQAGAMTLLGFKFRGRAPLWFEALTEHRELMRGSKRSKRCLDHCFIQ